jgi:formamidopyrimidine-DNA glycosylase
MPEVLEVELSRQAACDVIGRRVVAVDRTDPLIVADDVDDALPGAVVVGISRHGKLLVVDTDGPTVGIHFGMTGRLLRDGSAPAIDRLAFGAASDDAVWDRWIVRLDDGTRLRLHDPRRFGRVWLEPEVDRLGPDVLTLTRADLAAALARRRAPLKSVLLDQHSLAGLGNLLVDEVLWWAALDPRQVAATLEPADVARLHGVIRRRLPAMLRRGGSHTGTLSPERRAVGGACPRCGGQLRRDVVGGRTTVWCPSHQH